VLTSDEGDFAAFHTSRQADACHAIWKMTVGAGVPDRTACPQGPTGAAEAAPPLAARVKGLAMPWRARPVDSVDSPNSGA